MTEISTHPAPMAPQPPPPAVVARQAVDWRVDLAIFLGGFAFFWLIGLDGSAVGAATLAAIGLSGFEGSFFGGVLVAALGGAALALNWRLISVLPKWGQFAVVWAELLVLFLAFFYSFDLSYPFIIERIPILIFTGAFTTVYVSLISIAFAFIIALGAALARMSSFAPASAVAMFYISFFRGTPLLLQVFLIYLGLPQLGIVLDAVPSGIIALTLCYGAYMAEIFRAGIESIPKGQREAGLALGLPPVRVMRFIILPQAIRIVIPPTGNQFIAMLKDSSLVSVMGVQELMFLARTQGRSEFKHFEMLITAALIYWALSVVFELLQARLESHYAKSDRR